MTVYFISNNKYRNVTYYGQNLPFLSWYLFLWASRVWVELGPVCMGTRGRFPSKLLHLALHPDMIKFNFPILFYYILLKPLKIFPRNQIISVLGWYKTKPNYLPSWRNLPPLKGRGELSLTLLQFFSSLLSFKYLGPVKIKLYFYAIFLCLGWGSVVQ